MDYRRLVSDSWMDGGWQHSLLRHASLEDVTLALAYKGLKYGYFASYPPEQIGAQKFASDVLRAVGITTVEINNLGYRHKVCVKPLTENSARIISPMLVEQISNSLLKKSKISELFKKAQTAMCRPIKRMIMSTLAGLVIGSSGLDMTAYMANIQSPLITEFLHFLPLSLGTFILGGWMGFYISNLKFRQSRRDALLNLEYATAPTVYREWIAAAGKHGYSKITISNLAESTFAAGKKVIELNAANMPAIRDTIDLALDRRKIGQGGGFGFSVTVHSDNSALQANYAWLIVTLNFDNISSNNKKRRRRLIPRFSGELFPIPQTA